jgi:hypothetical protein
MAHTHSQDLEDRFNSLHSNFKETQQEVRQLSANVATFNKNMHSPIDAKMEDLKQDLATQLESFNTYFGSFTTMLCAKIHIPACLPSSDPLLQTEDETSSHSQNFHPHHFQRDLRLPHVDVTKFDGSDPTSWVTQMEHYLSLYGIIDELNKLRYGVLHLDQERSHWWQWRKNARQGYVAWTHFVADLYERFDTDTNHLGRLTKLKQFGIVEDFIVAFE